MVLNDDILEVDDSCCMTAATKNNGVFMVEESKIRVSHIKISGKRIAQAVRSTVAYRKKKPLTHEE